MGEMASAVSLSVFDNVDDYHGYFAGGQTDTALLRQSVDMRDVASVHELSDASTGSTAIELELVPQSVAESGVSVGSGGAPAAVVMLQAPNKDEHNRWLGVLRGLVAATGGRLDEEHRSDDNQNADGAAGVSAKKQKQHGVFIAEPIDLRESGVSSTPANFRGDGAVDKLPESPRHDPGSNAEPSPK